MIFIECFRPGHERGIVHTFGKSWGAPINECPRAETPFGVACIQCGVLFVQDDRGVLTTAYFVEGRGGELVRLDGGVYCAYHLRCFLTSTLGGAMSAELMAKLELAGEP